MNREMVAVLYARDFAPEWWDIAVEMSGRRRAIDKHSSCSLRRVAEVLRGYGFENHEISAAANELVARGAVRITPNDVLGADIELVSACL